MYSIRRSVVVVAVVGLVMRSIGCHRPTAGACVTCGVNGNRLVLVGVSSTSRNTFPQSDVTLQPLRIALFIDETLSMAGASVSRVTPESLAPVLERLANSGG